MEKIDRTYEIGVSNEGYDMKIIRYNNAHDIIVEIQDKYKSKIHTQYISFKRGNVKNPYHKSVFRTGYIGEGKYNTNINGKETISYQYWRCMLQRCYDAYFINKRLTYKDVTVCEEWHCYQTFCEWFEKNYYEISGEKMCLDKDILVKGNKIYSPETCIFVPNRINVLFTKSDKNRGNLPIGLKCHKQTGKVEAGCSIFKNGKKKYKYLGVFDNGGINKAFNVYKTFKESYIKQVADEYKNRIPYKLYDAMQRYEVEITD